MNLGGCGNKLLAIHRGFFAVYPIVSQPASPGTRFAATCLRAPGLIRSANARRCVLRSWFYALDGGLERMALRAMHDSVHSAHLGTHFNAVQISFCALDQ